MPCRAKSLQSCQTLCSSMDCIPLGFSLHGIFQARILASALLQGIFQTQGLNLSPAAPALEVDSLPLSHWGSPNIIYIYIYIYIHTHTHTHFPPYPLFRIEDMSQTYIGSISQLWACIPIRQEVRRDLNSWITLWTRRTYLPWIIKFPLKC